MLGKLVIGLDHCVVLLVLVVTRLRSFLLVDALVDEFCELLPVLVVKSDIDIIAIQAE